MDPNRKGRSAWTGCSSTPGATSGASSRSTFIITTESDLTVLCNFKHQSRKSSRGRRFRLTQRCVGEIDLAGCCTNTTRRQHDRMSLCTLQGFPTNWAFGSTFGMLGMNGSAGVRYTDSGVTIAVMRNRFTTCNLTAATRIDRIVTENLP